ncbi:MAG TPA: tetratricopeptide repeat protein [Gemmatimonadales bacterium]|nr:tetratricopeptide repeat protein [Gemmatimonadales bacterium]
MLLPFLLILQSPCPQDSTARAALDQGWREYRADRIQAAARAFAVADSLCPTLRGVRTGLGFADLRLGRTEDAAADFRAAAAADSGDADAWYGLGLARRRQGNREEAIADFQRALRAAPGYGDAQSELLGLGVAPPTAPAPRPAETQVPARISGDHFEVRTPAGWRRFYLRGINLGAALPGKFPSEFPQAESTYTRWLGLMAAAHANVVRVYTVHPPAFYRALKDWNDAHPEQALWLIHGVWAEPPPRDDYDDPAWRSDFLAEMRRVVDIIHGHALLGARPGHSYGRYDADVSDHTLAYLIGREWEPATIVAFDSLHPADTTFTGRFLTLPHGTPADEWMAAQCDSMLGLEWDLYHTSRPIAYTNWPTLDPLHHPTEPTGAEEAALRKARGIPADTALREYDNDAESLDAALIHPTAANLGGWYVSYHAYPYYPDFMDLDPGYGAARSSYGPSHYFGYLLDLKRHYAGLPIIISEYGVPSSRGDAHRQPEGVDHGGHDERAMAQYDVRLTKEIREAGLAGGVLFAWLDEWFKHNWPVIDLETPAERTRLWHNAMDAEQNYGLLGEYAGDTATLPVLGGNPAQWRALPVLEADSLTTLRVGSDAAYLYLAIESAGDPPGYVVGIDTYDRRSGQFLLPGLTRSDTVGYEFALTLRDTAQGRMWVAPWYSPYLVPRTGMGPTALDPFYQYGATVAGAGARGDWDSMWVTTNRWRIARDGRTFPAQGFDRGRLRFGSEAASTLSDWYVDRTAKLVEVRIAWGLLNVTDPSSHRVLTGISASDGFQTDSTDGFRFGVTAVDRAGVERDRLAPGPTYSWPGWEVPVSHERLKPAYFAIRDLWSTW